MNALYDDTRSDWRKGCYVARQKYNYLSFTKIIELIYADYSIYENYACLM